MHRHARGGVALARGVVHGSPARAPRREREVAVGGPVLPSQADGGQVEAGRGGPGPALEVLSEIPETQTAKACGIASVSVTL